MFPQLFRTKSIEQLVREAGPPGASVAPRAGSLVDGGARHRRDHRHGDLHPDRDSGGRGDLRGRVLAEGALARPAAPRLGGHGPDGTARGRTCRGRLLRPGGSGLRAGGLLLRRAVFGHPDCRQRLHLHLRDARRAGRLDHGLEPDSRIRGQQHGRGGGIFPLTSTAFCAAWEAFFPAP